MNYTLPALQMPVYTCALPLTLLPTLMIPPPRARCMNESQVLVMDCGSMAPDAVAMETACVLPSFHEHVPCPGPATCFDNDVEVAAHAAAGFADTVTHNELRFPLRVPFLPESSTFSHSNLPAVFSAESEVICARRDLDSKLFDLRPVEMLLQDDYERALRWRRQRRSTTSTSTSTSTGTGTISMAAAMAEDTAARAQLAQEYGQELMHLTCYPFRVLDGSGDDSTGLLASPAPRTNLAVLVAANPFLSKKFSNGLNQLTVYFQHDAIFKPHFSQSILTLYPMLHMLFSRGMGTKAETIFDTTVQNLTSGPVVESISYRGRASRPYKPYSHLSIDTTLSTALFSSLVEAGARPHLIWSGSNDSGVDQSSDGESGGGRALSPWEHFSNAVLPDAPVHTARDTALFQCSSMALVTPPTDELVRHGRVQALLRDVEYIGRSPAQALALLMGQAYEEEDASATGDARVAHLLSLDARGREWAAAVAGQGDGPFPGTQPVRTPSFLNQWLRTLQMLMYMHPTTRARRTHVQYEDDKFESVDSIMFALESTSASVVCAALFPCESEWKEMVEEMDASQVAVVRADQCEVCRVCSCHSLLCVLCSNPRPSQILTHPSFRISLSLSLSLLSISDRWFDKRFCASCDFWTRAGRHGATATRVRVQGMPGVLLGSARPTLR